MVSRLLCDIVCYITQTVQVQVKVRMKSFIKLHLEQKTCCAITFITKVLISGIIFTMYYNNNSTWLQCACTCLVVYGAMYVCVLGFV